MITAPRETRADAPMPAFGAYRIDQLGSGRCRFACTGLDGPHRFCGRPTQVGRLNRHGSWCADHLAVVFTASRPGGPAARAVGGASAR